MTRKLFLDTVVVIDAIWNDGPSKLLLTLGEVGAVRLCVSSRVLAEVESVVRRKTPATIGALAVLLDQCGVSVIPRAVTGVVRQAQAVVRDPHTAYIVADAGAAGVDFFVTFDKERIIHNDRLVDTAPFTAGSPEACIAWLKHNLASV